MMSVGNPSFPDPNQSTTKPRQLPNGGSTPGGDADSSDTPFGEGNFDPDSMGADVAEQRAENADPDDDPDDHDDGDGGMAPENVDSGTTLPGGKPEGVVARLAAMVADIQESNPGLDRRMATVIATEAMAEILAIESVYSYDPSMHTHDFDTGQSLFNRFLRDIGKPKGPVDPEDPMRPTRLEEGIKDRVQKAKDFLSPNKPVVTPQQGPPGPQSGPESPRDPAAPEEDEDAKPVKTMGEWARDTMKQYPSTQKDLWQHRHDPRPYKPEGYNEGIPVL